MALNRDEINPLNLLGLRKLNFIPDHFKKISFSFISNTREIEKWINFNLNSRYGIRNNYIVNQENKIVKVTEIGIEDPNELLILSLGCNHLHKHKKEI